MRCDKMTDWEHIWRLFYQAIELPAAEQADWLLRHNDVTADHRRLLEQLLQAHQSTDSMLDRPLTLERPLLHNGSKLGCWKIVRMIARGGYGEVYQASRCDGAFTRDVAIKIYSPEIAGVDSRENFLREQKILASLEHPNITRLLDAGHSGGGMLYLVMEYVNGSSLLQHCLQQRAGLMERLKLFEQICSAVDYAHRQLVVHGDLHPGNIMVCRSETGWQTKLLDFGVSRLITGPGQTGAHGCTPDYASPEQCLRQPVTTASDVFAVGVILCVLLTGQTPFAAAAAQPTAYLRAVTQGPQSLAELAHTDQTGIALSTTQLPAELDWMKNRCLCYQPEQRYRGMHALLQDLRRLREHYPVQAKPVTNRYRLRKYLRRNWRWAGGTALLLLLLSGQLLLLYQQQQRTEQALQRTELQRQRAQATVSFLASLFDLADRTRHAGESADAVTMLALGHEQLLHDQTLSDELKIPLISTLSEIYRNLGDYDKAMQLASHSRTLADESADVASLAAADLAIGKIQFLAGELQASVRTLEQSLQDIPWDRTAAMTSLRLDMLLALGTSLQHLGDLQQAGAYFHQAERLSETREDANSVLQQAEVLLRLGSWHWSSGRLEQARDHYFRALQAHQALPERHLPELARAVDAYASALLALGEYTASAEQFQRAVKMRRKALGDRNRLTADSLSNLGAAYYEAGQDQPASEVLQQAWQIYQLLGLDTHQAVGKVLNNLGLVKLRLGNTAEARELFAQALAIHKNRLGQQHIKVAGNLNNLGLAEELQNKLSAAAEHYRQALLMQQHLLGDEHPSLAIAYTNLARTEMLAGHYSAAEPLYRRADEILQRAYDEENINRAGTLFWWGMLSCVTGQHERALKLLQQAHTLRLTLDQQHPDRQLARAGLAVCKMTTETLPLADLATAQRHWLAVQLHFPKPHPWHDFMAAMLDAGAQLAINE